MRGVPFFTPFVQPSTGSPDAVPPWKFSVRGTQPEFVPSHCAPENCTIECPRHGSVFDLRTGKPLNLPAYVPVDTFPVLVEDGVIRVEVD